MKPFELSTCPELPLFDLHGLGTRTDIWCLAKLFIKFYYCICCFNGHREE